LYDLHSHLWIQRVWVRNNCLVLSADIWSFFFNKKFRRFYERFKFIYFYLWNLSTKCGLINFLLGSESELKMSERVSHSVSIHWFIILSQTSVKNSWKMFTLCNLSIPRFLKIHRNFGPSSKRLLKRASNLKLFWPTWYSRDFEKKIWEYQETRWFSWKKKIESLFFQHL